MKLRNFLFLNTKVIEDYISAIDGIIYDEESQAIATSNENAVSGRARILTVGGSGERSGRKEEEIKRSVKISDSSKFDRIYEYLDSNEDEGLKYYESLNDDIYDELQRDTFLEVLVTPRFSKMKELTDSAKKFAELAAIIESITEQELLDHKTTQAINGLSALRPKT